VASTWTVEWNSSNRHLYATWPGGDARELCSGGVLTVAFRAIAPAAEGLYTWATQLRRGGTIFKLNGSQPTVRVVGAAPPPPTIAGGPASPTNQRSASFVFSDSAAGLTFSCRLDGANFAPCTSPVTYRGLSDGAHTFRVRATDAAGNTSAASAYNWTVDTIAPNTAISSGPAAASSSASATFVFAATEQSSFSCSLDGGAFAPCVSPQTYGGLANGTHAFRVRATDAASNIDPSPASYGWTVNAVVPTQIDRTPPANVSKVAKLVRYRLLKLSWKPPPDADFDHVVIVVGKNPRRAPTTPVYRGAGTSYTNSKFRNGFYHRYAITSYDRSGNASRRVAVVVSASVLLTSPRAGARLRRPPLLDWASVPKATYYNIQLYLGSRKVLTAWPSRSKIKLRRVWEYQDSVNRLKKGTYRWYVWPGFGRRSQVRYGQLLGQATFVVTR
jgi:Bacterial Ig-like domain